MKKQLCRISAVFLLTLTGSFSSGVDCRSKGDAQEVRKIDGYRGIWFDLGQRSEFGSKYSGGLGTYTAKHRPLAIHAEAVDKTFFVYGGTTRGDERHLLAMASYYDHATGQVPRPTVVHDKEGVDDPHDDPSLQIDEGGHLWIFVSGRGRHRPGYIYKSLRPYDIEGFEQTMAGEFTYPQPWWIEGTGFLHLFTRYTAGRELYWKVSDRSGREWTAAQKLAGMGGHYQMSVERNGIVATAFNYHPGGNVDQRTNMYFLWTDDLGKSWKTAGGTVLETPLTDPATPALIHDYESEGRLVYLKDMDFDEAGQPVLLYLTSGWHQPGPKGDPRIWTIARWDGSEWIFSEVTRSTHNYDMGSLYIEPDGTWKIFAPTEPGPQRYGTGGEVAIWQSDDKGATWRKIRDLTNSSPRNHGYVRRPEMRHPGFYAFWADGNPDSLSESHLYFTNQSGDQVWELPYEMDGDRALVKAKTKRTRFKRRNPSRFR